MNSGPKPTSRLEITLMAWSYVIGHLWLFRFFSGNWGHFDVFSVYSESTRLIWFRKVTRNQFSPSHLTLDGTSMLWSHLDQL
jgi:hypothetical protein